MKNRFLLFLSSTCVLLLSSCIKEPQPIKVTGISINPTSITLVEGKTADLIATISPSDADNQKVIWASNDGSIASVNNGKVTAIKPGSTTVIAKSDDGGFTATCSVTITPKPIEVTSINLSESELILMGGDTLTLVATVKPDDATNKAVSWSTSEASIATIDNGKVTAVNPGTAVITVSSVENPLIQATCSVTVSNAPQNAVDLGLSVMWAPFNVGAKKPEDYGDYFAWGETEPKSEYSWDTYKWCNGTSSSLTKYNMSLDYGIVDNKTQLDLSDDAARASWGGKWRMPTDAEWTELRNNCTWTWTTQNGVNGRKVTSKVNGNSIFLPAAGARYGTTLYDAGSYGGYWSSALNTGYPGSAYYVYFYSDGVYRYYGYGRYYGQSVRPVFGEFVEVSSISLNKTSANLNIGESFTLSATIKPSNATAKDIYWSSSNPDIASVSTDGVVTGKADGTATITAYSSNGLSASCTVTVKLPIAEAVDLGLSVKWASFNVGANKPEEYGYYFAWGETEPKSEYSWDTYKWCNGTSSSLTKYNMSLDYGIVDNKTQLDLSDDAARASWGGKWRMPTLTESDELRANCIWAWTTRNGIKGFNVTSKINGKSIFLPAAGFRYMEGWTAVGIDNEGYYWSSSLDTDQTGRAGGMYFQEVGGEFGMRLGRFYGISVRPVYGDFVEIVSISLDKSSANLDVGESLTLTATINPNNATEKTIRWSTSNPDIASVSNGVVTAKTVGSATITAYSSNGLSASCTVTVTAPDPRAVDLGLSVKWASCNVGASAPEDLGSVFAWGETSTKSVYSTWNYRFHKRVNDLYHFTITKYNDVDNKIILDPEDDAAHVNWGGKWRTPTKEEFSELINNCIVDLDIYYGYISPNGSMACKGARLTSKVNGNSIFLPIDQNHYYPYWTSTLVPYRNAYSWHVFYRLGLSAYQYGFDHECYRENPGHIRPVSD